MVFARSSVFYGNEGNDICYLSAMVLESSNLQTLGDLSFNDTRASGPISSGRFSL